MSPPIRGRRPAATGRRRIPAGEELELKLDGDDLAALRGWLDEQLPAADGERWRATTVRDRYFDTPDERLARAGYGARLRGAGGVVTLGLKSDVEQRGALHHRRELEAPATERLAPGDWPPSDARRLVEELAAGQRLVERFRLKQRRLERDQPLDGARVKLSLDDVRVLVGGTPAGQLRQLEVELVEGDRRTLATLERRLRASGLVRPQRQSKMALAASLATAASAVRAEDAWVEAGRKVLRRHLLRMLEREPLVRGGDTQALKQMRVATRRARATWRLFGDGFQRGTRRRHVASLRELGRSLGAVRDLDVLLEALPADRRLADVAAEWRRQRDAAFGELRATLDGQAHHAFVADFLELTVRRRAGRRRSRRGTTVAELAPAALRDDYRALVDGAPLDWSLPDASAWHALRRRSRRLRYTIEALGEVVAAAQAARLIARLVRVQDHLGKMNDALVGAEALDDWLNGAGQSAAATRRRAASEYRDEWLAQAERLRAGFPPVWRGVAGATFARMLERAVVEPLTER